MRRSALLLLAALALVLLPAGRGLASPWGPRGPVDQADAAVALPGAGVLSVAGAGTRGRSLEGRRPVVDALHALPPDDLRFGPPDADVRRLAASAVPARGASFSPTSRSSRGPPPAVPVSHVHR